MAYQKHVNVYAKNVPAMSAKDLTTPGNQEWSNHQRHVLVQAVVTTKLCYHKCQLSQKQRMGKLCPSSILFYASFHLHKGTFAVEWIDSSDLF